MQREHAETEYVNKVSGEGVRLCSMKFESFLRANTITDFSRENSNHSISSILQDKQGDTRVSICKPE